MNNRFLEINGVYETPKPKPKPKLSNHFLEINSVYTPPPPPPPPPAPKPAPTLSARFYEINGAPNPARETAQTAALTTNLAQLTGTIPQTPPAPAPAPRFNDVVGDQSGIHGFDPAGPGEADALFGYLGTDGTGAQTAGIGLLDVESDDPNAGLQGMEILTAEGRFNLHDLNDDFIGADLDAHVFSTDVNVHGHSLNFGYLTANALLGGGQISENEVRAGVMVGANLIEGSYQNGAPSADNPSDLTVGGTLSYGPNLGGFAFTGGDPDQDGVMNLGVEVAIGPVGGMVSSEAAGAALQGEMQNVTNAYYNAAFGADLPVDDRGVVERATDWVKDAFTPNFPWSR